MKRGRKPLRRTPLRTNPDSVRAWLDKHRGSLKPGSGPERSTPLAPVNRERRKRLYARNFGDHADHIRTLSCDGCGARVGIQASHAKARGMGGCGGDRTHLVPHCATCHDAYHDGKLYSREHAMERAAFYWAASPHNEGENDANA